MVGLVDGVDQGWGGVCKYGSGQLQRSVTGVGWRVSVGGFKRAKQGVSEG